MSENPHLWFLKCGTRHVVYAVLALLTLTNSHSAFGSTRFDQEFSSCDIAAVHAGRMHNVPLDVLRAVTRVETGRTAGTPDLQPWPWTVNMEGAGHWFDSRDEAKSFVFKHFKRGARSFDVGCFQINYKWHGHAFVSFDDMFDPQKNAAYAALFLKSLHQEFGNWRDAVGAFHSRSPQYADIYTARFDRIYSSLQPEEGLEQVSDAPRARFSDPVPLAETAPALPLMQQGEVRLGSLVPIETGFHQSPALIDLH
ncbi:MAG: transglycosylase SLT domain-containing protein [Rhodobacteraceae bacterium]|nr:transglycosylase SLT domain-containing protein [Paracoccaceae bacterium]